jgi:hypothetical protein
MTDDELREHFKAVQQRLERLEKFLGIADLPVMPGFDPATFQRILLGYLGRILLPVFIPLFVLFQVFPSRFYGQVSQSCLFGLPIWNTGGEPSVLGLPIGIVSLGGGAIGVVSFGGLAIGALAFGGGAFGIVAIGGGAFGIVSIGGGSFGLIAVGGGAVGYIAIGGGAYGKYVLAGDGSGKYVFNRRRQDEEAVRFFCKYLPRLRQAFTIEGR